MRQLHMQTYLSKILKVQQLWMLNEVNGKGVKKSKGECRRDNHPKDLRL